LNKKNNEGRNIFEMSAEEVSAATVIQARWRGRCARVAKENLLKVRARLSHLRFVFSSDLPSTSFFLLLLLFLVCGFFL
jgi:hypothetical protein